MSIAILLDYPTDIYPTSYITIPICSTYNTHVLHEIKIDKTDLSEFDKIFGNISELDEFEITYS